MEFPTLNLPITPPYPPMEARTVARIPSGEEWLYEPKWDGFRCLAFRDGNVVALQSKAGQPLTRYFPELVDALLALQAPRFVLDGEIVVVRSGTLSFDDLLMRIHPAESRVRRLAAETPARLLVFDFLVDARGRDLTALPLGQRLERLTAFLEAAGPSAVIERSPSSADQRQAERWMTEYAAFGCDGVVAKRAHEPYHSGDREGMQKIKRLRTADCVVGGFRYASRDRGAIGSLLLGLYNDAGELDHVGFAASFTAKEGQALTGVVEPLKGGDGFTGRAPGGPSRWSSERSGEWEPLEPRLVCEVRYDAGLATFLHAPQLAAPAPVGASSRERGGAIHALHPAHFNLLRRGLGSDVVVQRTRLGLLDVLIDQQADDDVLMAAERAGDPDAIAFADGAIRLGGLTVDRDFAALAGALGFRPCLEQTRYVQPDVQTNQVAHIFNLR